MIMSNDKTYPTKNQSQITKEIRSRDVKNLHELPFFLASKPKEFRTEILLNPEKHPEGGILERVVNISAYADKNSRGEIVPLYLDTVSLEYWLWLFHLWQQMPEPERSKGVVRWTRYQIHKLMGKSVGGQSCKIHDDHIIRLGRVTFGITDCFFSKATNQKLKKVRNFNILSFIDLTEIRDGEVVMLDECQATINPLLIENFLYGYTKPVNLSVFSSIHWKSNIAKKLYLKLDLQFSGDLDRFEMTTERFFRENGIIGTKYNHAANRKQNLEKAIKQLLGKKFSSNKTIKSYKFSKTADGKDWKVTIWAHQWTVLSSPEPENKPPKASKSSSEKPAIEVINAAQKQNGLVPIAEAVSKKTNLELAPTQTKTTDDVTVFLDQFIKLFAHADRENIYRSRAIKQKTEEFINQYGIKSALQFLGYAKQQSKQSKASKLSQAETPIYLFKSKLNHGLVDSWIEERKRELEREKATIEQDKKHREEERIAFANSKLAEYDSYLNQSLQGFSTMQKKFFQSYFEEKEQEHLKDKKQFYINRYHGNSSLMKMPFWRQTLIEFSKEIQVTLLSIDEYIKTYYPQELHYYQTGEGKQPELSS